MSETHQVDTTAKLVTMVNQIARNLARDKDPVSAIADHIHAFWSVRMREQLFAHGPAGLDPLSQAALDRLAAGAPSPHRQRAADPREHASDAG